LAPVTAGGRTDGGSAGRLPGACGAPNALAARSPQLDAYFRPTASWHQTE